MKYLIVFFLILGACGKAGDSNSNAQASSTARTWSASFPSWQLYIDMYSTDVQKISWNLAYGQTCDSAAVVGASTITIALSTQTSAVKGSDVPCTMFDGTWTYSISGSALTISSAATGSPVTLY